MSTAKEIRFGNEYNYWIQTPDGMDLTRGEKKTKTLNTTKEPITIAPARSALIVIDMQNYFCHPKLLNNWVGREFTPLLMETVKAARKAGMPVVWCNMGFHKGDAITMPPHYLKMSYGGDKVLFGESIGMEGDIDMGARLARGSWNAQLWGPLPEFADEGIKAGTDHWIWKNRFSALCNGDQALNLWLEENQITTCFTCGVSTDVCVWGTTMDAYYLGYDIVLIKDLSGCTKPQHQTDTALYQAERWGWVVEAKDIIAGLE